MLFVVGIIVGALITILGVLFVGFIISNPGDRKVLNFAIAAGMIILGIYIISSTMETMELVNASQSLVDRILQ